MINNTAVDLQKVFKTNLAQIIFLTSRSICRWTNLCSGTESERKKRNPTMPRRIDDSHNEFIPASNGTKVVCKHCKDYKIKRNASRQAKHLESCKKYKIAIGDSSDPGIHLVAPSSDTSSIVSGPSSIVSGSSSRASSIGWGRSSSGVVAPRGARKRNERKTRDAKEKGNGSPGRDHCSVTAR